MSSGDNGFELSPLDFFLSVTQTLFWEGNGLLRPCVCSPSRLVSDHLADPDYLLNPGNWKLLHTFGSGILQVFAHAREMRFLLEEIARSGQISIQR